MNETIERAHETIHEAGHAGGHDQISARRIAVLVAVLAAGLSVVEMGAKSSQNDYLTSHVALSDNWAFFQSKNARAVSRESEANILASLPNAADPSVQTRIKAAQDYAHRMRDDAAAGDGMAQLSGRAKGLEHEREEALHRYHGFELASGALQIAIVLASVSLVTRVRALTLAAGAIGLAAGLYGLGTVLHVV